MLYNFLIIMGLIFFQVSFSADKVQKTREIPEPFRSLAISAAPCPSPKIGANSNSSHSSDSDSQPTAFSGTRIVTPKPQRPTSAGFQYIAHPTPSPEPQGSHLERLTGSGNDCLRKFSSKRSKREKSGNFTKKP